MKNRKITIENGIISIPDEVSMSIAELADLFDIYYQTTKRHIRAIEKSGVTNGDYSQSCSCDGWKIYPDYYGLEMVIAVAFRIHSPNTNVFREWIVRKVIQNDTIATLILPLQNPMFN